MYEHDKKLTKKFAEDNPEVIDSAREKLTIRLGHYECTVNFHKYWPDKDLGDTIDCPVCGEKMVWKPYK